MYNAVVQRVQRLEIAFDDNDFEDWKKQNPHAFHTHENFVKSMAEVLGEVPESWNTYEQDIVCIIYSKEES